ncbi:MAG: DoxX family membrane protein [Candidatus Liptonbacteria bacterium]|nr:DoxX family membrane protein [Candidatus Liptonbacteria bacterium]
MDSRNLASYAPVVLRLALALVFLWFGTSQLTTPAAWTGFVPAWALNISGMGAATIVHVNGWFEVVASVLLGLGVAVRPVAFLLFMHLAGIAASLGMTELGVRDFGLSMATLAVALSGEDRLCLLRKRE